MKADFWDERYGEAEFVYGEAPNDFVKEVLPTLGKGKLLEVGCGEGRNSVYAAKLGFTVSATDQSVEGLRKTKLLADKNDVVISGTVADIADFSLGDNQWDVIVATFFHLPPELRADVHRRIVTALAPGGTLVFEAYRPEHLDMPGKGGPPVAEMLPTLDQLKHEFEGLEFEVATEVEREVNEGKYHHGLSATVQIIAKKPE